MGSSKEIETLQSSVFERLKNEHPQLEGELTYNEINLKEDAKKAVELLANDKDRAYRIAMGVEEAPEGQTSTAINIAMSEKALDEGNNKLYAQLIKTRSLEQTKRGQEIVAEKGSITDNSTSKYVKELISARLDSLGKRYLTNLDISTKEGVSIKSKSNKMRAMDKIDSEIQKVKKEIAKTKKMDLADAQKLLDSLMC